MHSHLNPLVLNRPVYYSLNPWAITTDDFHTNTAIVKLHVEIIVVPAGMQGKKLRIEFVNITGDPLPARPKTKEQITYLLDTMVRLLKQSIECSCCVDKEIKPITMHQVCWGGE